MLSSTVTFYRNMRQLNAAKLAYDRWLPSLSLCLFSLPPPSLSLFLCFLRIFFIFLSYLCHARVSSFVLLAFSMILHSDDAIMKCAIMKIKNLLLVESKPHWIYGSMLGDSLNDFILVSHKQSMNSPLYRKATYSFGELCLFYENILIKKKYIFTCIHITS